MIKILLTSDTHLGIGDSAVPIPETVRMATFRKICALAAEHDLLLIAGDFFHGDSVLKETVEIVAREFSALREKNVEVVYTPGDHEITEGGNPHPYLYQAGASHIFSGPGEADVYSFRRHNQRLFIYGLPATGNNDIAGIRKQAGEGFHIGLFHADFNLGDDRESAKVYILQKSDIKSLNLDFYALGHHHFFRLFKFQNRIIGAYPGSPEAVSFNETGDRYVLSISIENNEIYQIKRLTVNAVKLKDVALDCTEARSCMDLTEILQKNRSPRTLLRITLNGFRKFHLGEDLYNEFASEYYKLILEDKTSPSMDILIEEFSRENSLRGEFYTFLRDKMAQQDFPADVDLEEISRILNGISRKGHYSPEEWLC